MEGNVLYSVAPYGAVCGIPVQPASVSFRFSSVGWSNLTYPAIVVTSISLWTSLWASSLPSLWHCCSYEQVCCHSVPPCTFLSLWTSLWASSLPSLWHRCSYEQVCCHSVPTCTSLSLWTSLWASSLPSLWHCCSYEQVCCHSVPPWRPSLWVNSLLATSHPYGWSCCCIHLHLLVDVLMGELTSLIVALLFL